MHIFKISLKHIDQDRNSRTEYKPADVVDLMRSMKKDTQLQAIGVRPSNFKLWDEVKKNPAMYEKRKGRWDALFGNRRILAAKKLGWDEIDANILDDVKTENDRDFINLTENMKRQGTSVAEDGRIFLILKDRGLEIEEIAARLDISKDRVELAIDTFKEVPKDLRHLVVNRTGGQKVTGTISATSMLNINKARKNFNLKPKAFRSLLNFAKDNSTTAQHVTQIAPLLAAGKTVEQALKASRSMKRVALSFFMDAREVERLEKKHGTTITDIIMTHLEKSREFSVKRNIVGSKYRNKPRDLYPDRTKPTTTRPQD